MHVCCVQAWNKTVRERGLSAVHSDYCGSDGEGCVRVCVWEGESVLHVLSVWISADSDGEGCVGVCVCVCVCVCSACKIKRVNT